MKNRRLAFALFLPILATAVFAAERANLLAVSSLERSSAIIGPPQPQLQPSGTESTANDKSGALIQSQSPEIPKHVVYGLLFREMAAFKKKAQELEAQGKDGSFLEDYHKKRANLNDSQSAALDKIAEDCQSKVDDLEQQAKRIIDGDRALHPGGKLKEGEPLPKPPPQLKGLEQRRINAIMRARDDVHAVFGDSAFQRLDDFEQQDVSARAKPMTRAPHPTAPPANGFKKH